MVLLLFIPVTKETDSEWEDSIEEIIIKLQQTKIRIAENNNQTM